MFCGATRNDIERRDALEASANELFEVVVSVSTGVSHEHNRN
jgi:hypothetical protein